MKVSPNPSHCHKVMRYYGFKSHADKLFNKYQCDECNKIILKQVYFKA